ncbi:MAG: hypothetical protein OJF50_004633 [Nitrospira sp.]|nr:hypothetical protein [Nitrospira sp.]
MAISSVVEISISASGGISAPFVTEDREHRQTAPYGEEGLA